MTIPFPQMLQTTITASAMKASSQFWLALLIAVGAKIRPIEMMIGPVTTGGKKRMILRIPKTEISADIKTYTSPATKTPPQA